MTSRDTALSKVMSSIVSSQHYKPPKPRYAEPSTNPKSIDAERVRELRKSWKNWSVIANELGVEIKTLYRWRKDSKFVDVFYEPNAAELDGTLRQYLHENPGHSEAVTMTYLKSKGWYVKRQALRNSILRVDPNGRKRRLKAAQSSFREDFSERGRKRERIKK